MWDQVKNPEDRFFSQFEPRLRVTDQFRLKLGSTDMARGLKSRIKDINSTVAKRGSVFIGLMTPNGAIWFRYQRAGDYHISAGGHKEAP